jgi:hypothetical protein
MVVFHCVVSESGLVAVVFMQFFLYNVIILVPSYAASVIGLVALDLAHK